MAPYTVTMAVAYRVALYAIYIVLETYQAIICNLDMDRNVQ